MLEKSIKMLNYENQDIFDVVLIIPFYFQYIDMIKYVLTNDVK